MTAEIAQDEKLKTDLNLNQQLQDLSKKRSQSQVNDKQYIPDPYKKVAVGMERQFLEFMLEQMNKTVGKEMSESTAMDYYKNLMKTEHSKVMSEKNGGMGVQDTILDQIYPKNRRSQLAYNNYLKSSGLLHKKNTIQQDMAKGTSEISINNKSNVGIQIYNKGALDE